MPPILYIAGKDENTGGLLGICTTTRSPLPMPSVLSALPKRLALRFVSALVYHLPSKWTLSYSPNLLMLSSMRLPMFMVPLPTAAAFLAENEAVCSLIALGIDSTLVASGRQAHILNDVFPLKFVHGVARV
jgi:hypothetical protein